MDVPCFGPGLPRPRLLRTRVRVQPLINMGTIGTGHADLSRSTRQCISVSWWCDLRPRILSVGGSSVPTDVIGPKQASADTATEIAIKWTNLCGFNGSKIVLALPCETVANLEGVGGRGSGVGGRGSGVAPPPPPVQPWTNVMILLEWDQNNRWTARQEGISDRSIPRCGVHCTMTLHSVPDPGGRGFNPQVLLLIWKLKILTKEFFKNSQTRPCEGPVKDLWEPTIIDGIIPPPPRRHVCVICGYVEEKQKYFLGRHITQSKSIPWNCQLTHLSSDWMLTVVWRLMRGWGEIWMMTLCSHLSRLYSEVWTITSCSNCTSVDWVNTRPLPSVIANASWPWSITTEIWFGGQGWRICRRYGDWMV